MRVPVFGRSVRGRWLIQDVKMRSGGKGRRRPSAPVWRFETGGLPRR